MRPIKNIIIDPGHGGIDPVTGKYTTAPNKMHKFRSGEVAYEGHLNRQIAAFVGAYLNNPGKYFIIYTVDPNDPRDISLQQRIRKANSYDAEDSILISIHCNASPNHNASGFELFTTKGYTLADELSESIAIQAQRLYQSVNLNLRYDLSDGDRDKEADFYVLRQSTMPAVLLECGFFDNQKDYVFLKTPAFQSKLAYYIAEGITNYIENEQN